jgi:hypothetical protein
MLLAAAVAAGPPALAHGAVLEFLEVQLEK